VTALTRDEFVEFAGDEFAVVVVAAAIRGLTRIYQVEAVMPSVRAGMISKGVNP
jgi:stress-induced morphogen